MAEMEGQRHVAAERQAADHRPLHAAGVEDRAHVADGQFLGICRMVLRIVGLTVAAHVPDDDAPAILQRRDLAVPHAAGGAVAVGEQRSEEHTSELQSLMSTSYAVFCLKKIKYKLTTNYIRTR